MDREESGRRIAILILIMTAIILVVLGVTISMLYRAAIEEQKQRLSEIARSQALHFEEITRANGIVAGSRVKKIDDAKLRELLESHIHYHPETVSGEVVVARREGDSMVFLFAGRFAEKAQAPTILPLDSPVAEPMRRALSGLSGTMVGIDYRGEKVLAAYEPVQALGLGVVAKIDLAEVKAPFVRAGLTAGSIALLLALVGAFLFLRVSSPMLRRIEESEERYRNIVENIEDIIYVFDDKGNITFVNSAAASKLGYSREEFLRLNTKSLLTTDSYKDITRVYKRQLAGENVGPFEVKLHGKGGAIHTVETRERLIWEQGRAKEVHGIGRDVTERKRAEEALRESEARYEDLYENAPDMFVSVDAKTAKIIKLQRDVCQGKRGTRRTRSSAAPSLKYIIRTAPNVPGKVVFPTFLKTGEVHGEELKILRKDGTTIDVMLSTSAVRDAKGKILYSRSVLRDITEKKRAEENLRALSNRQEAILDAVSDIIMEVDNNKVYTWANQAGLEFFGEDVIGKEAAGYFVGEQETYDRGAATL